ncbi:MAG: hypothetical protein M0P12_13955 [Paludibacteraceae bacterium]|nr:hypothetical protein [Paludibacteraceae bacterium]
METNTDQTKKEIQQIPDHLSLEDACRDLVRYAELVQSTCTEKEILKDPYFALQVLYIRRKGLEALLDLIQQYAEQPIKV